MSDLNEELLERAQTLWQSYKFHLIIVLLMIFSAIAGLLYESAIRAESRQTTGDNFFTLIRASEEGDVETANAALAGIDGEEFPEMRNLALMALATAQNTQGAAEAAIAGLREVIEQEKDEGLRFMAILRLAELLINNGQSAEALAVLEENPAEEGAMNLLFAERRGDAYYAAGQVQQARVEYLLALEEALSSFRSYVPVMNIKIGAVSSLLVENENKGDSAANQKNEDDADKESESENNQTDAVDSDLSSATEENQ